MSRFLRRHFKVAAVWSAIFILTVDSATACRLFARRARYSYQPVSCHVEVCCVDSQSTKPESDDMQDTPDSKTPDSDSLLKRPTMDDPSKVERPAPLSPSVKPPVAPPQVQPTPAIEPAPAPKSAPPKSPAPAPSTKTPPTGLEDLFNEKPKVDAPAVPPEAPAPKKPAPTQTLEDLFENPKPAEAPKVPAVEPKPAAEKPNPLDELFPAEPKPAPKAAPAAPGDIFGNPPANPAPAAPPAAKSVLDDVFDAVPAKEIKPAPGNDSAGVRGETTAELLVMRTWVDDTGSFSVTGRLFAVADGNVRLLKDNGKTCTVPTTRLSRADLEYVHMVVAKLGTGNLGHLAAQ